MLQLENYPDHSVPHFRTLAMEMLIRHKKKVINNCKSISFLQSSHQLTNKRYPGTPSKSPTPPAFAPIYNEALGLVEKETMVLPFTTPTGHVHILRHLAPEFIYLQESLAGENGEVINHLQSWLREDVVLVVGVDGGHGGLADSESEAESQISKKREQWWEREDRVGLGRGVVVVEGSRVGDYWARKVLGVE